MAQTIFYKIRRRNFNRSVVMTDYFYVEGHCGKKMVFAANFVENKCRFVADNYFNFISISTETYRNKKEILVYHKMLIETSWVNYNVINYDVESSANGRFCGQRWAII